MGYDANLPVAILENGKFTCPVCGKVNENMSTEMCSFCHTWVLTMGANDYEELMDVIRWNSVYVLQRSDIRSLDANGTV